MHMHATVCILVMYNLIIKIAMYQHPHLYLKYDLVVGFYWIYCPQMSLCHKHLH